MHDIGLSCLWRFWRCAEGMWPFSGRALRRADVGSRKSPVSLGFLMPVCFLMPRNRQTAYARCPLREHTEAILSVQH